MQHRRTEDEVKIVVQGDEDIDDSWPKGVKRES
jgi:hypothetical protein